MTTTELAPILAAHAQWISTNGAAGQQADLRGADLRGTDLRGADLTGADLRGAHLTGADLTEADLREADLTGADLTGADLTEADLYWADLRETDLRGANLRGANLRGANLRGTDLRGTAFGTTQVLQLGPLGSRHDYLVVKRFEDGSTEAMTGCFRGTLEEFEQAVAHTHRDNLVHLAAYRAAIAYCRQVFARAGEEAMG